MPWLNPMQAGAMRACFHRVRPFFLYLVKTRRADLRTGHEAMAMAAKYSLKVAQSDHHPGVWSLKLRLPNDPKAWRDLGDVAWRWWSRDVEADVLREAWGITEMGLPYNHSSTASFFREMTRRNFKRRQVHEPGAAERDAVLLCPPDCRVLPEDLRRAASGKSYGVRASLLRGDRHHGATSPGSVVVSQPSPSASPSSHMSYSDSESKPVQTTEPVEHAEPSPAKRRKFVSDDGSVGERPGSLPLPVPPSAIDGYGSVTRARGGSGEDEELRAVKRRHELPRVVRIPSGDPSTGLPALGALTPLVGTDVFDIAPPPAPALGRSMSQASTHSFGLPFDAAMEASTDVLGTPFAVNDCMDNFVETMHGFDTAPELDAPALFTTSSDHEFSFGG